MSNGLDERVARSRSIERLARWWNSATAEARFKILLAASKKDPEAPSIALLNCAIIVAETAKGEVSEG